MCMTVKHYYRVKGSYQIGPCHIEAKIFQARVTVSTEHTHKAISTEQHHMSLSVKTEELHNNISGQTL